MYIICVHISHMSNEDACDYPSQTTMRLKGLALEGFTNLRERCLSSKNDNKSCAINSDCQQINNMKLENT